MAAWADVMQWNFSKIQTDELRCTSKCGQNISLNQPVSQPASHPAIDFVTYAGWWWIPRLIPVQTGTMCSNDACQMLTN